MPLYIYCIFMLGTITHVLVPKHQTNVLPTTPGATRVLAGGSDRYNSEEELWR